jgi:hypothetical protein
LLPPAVPWLPQKLTKDLKNYPENDPLRQYLQAELDGLEQQIVEEVGELAELFDRLLNARHDAEIRRRAVAHRIEKDALKERRRSRDVCPDLSCKAETEFRSRLEAAGKEGLTLREREAAERSIKNAEQKQMLAQAPD